VVQKLFMGSISSTYLRAAFTHVDTNSTKRQSSHQFLFVLLGSLRSKAARKMLVKSTPGWKIFCRIGLRK